MICVENIPIIHKCNKLQLKNQKNILVEFNKFLSDKNKLFNDVLNDVRG